MSISLQNSYAREGAGASGIALALRRDVAAGRLSPAEQLPPIAALAQAYRTTAVTVRRALRMLEEEGLVRVEHGVGTFVADWSGRYDLLHLPSFSAEMAERNLRSETAVTARSSGLQDRAAAQALGLEPGALLTMLERVRRVEEVPVAVQRSYLAETFRGVVEAYTPDRSLYEMLRQEARRMPRSAEERLRAVLLPEGAARGLGCDAGAPAWRSRRTTYDAQGEPLVYDEAFFPGERVELRVHRGPGRSEMEYLLDLPGCKV